MESRCQSAIKGGLSNEPSLYRPLIELLFDEDTSEASIKLIKPTGC